MQIPGKPFLRFIPVKKLSYLTLVFLATAGSSQAQSLGLNYTRVYGNYYSSVFYQGDNPNYFETRGGKAYDISLTGSYSFEPWDREHNYKWVVGLELNRSLIHYSIVQTGYNSANQVDLKPKPSSIRTNLYQAGTSLTPSFAIKLNADKPWNLLLGANIIYRLRTFNFSETSKDIRFPEIYTEVNVMGWSNFSVTPQLFAMFEYHVNKRHSILLGMEVALLGRAFQHIQLVQHVYGEQYFHESYTYTYSVAAFNIGYNFNFLRNEE